MESLERTGSERRTWRMPGLDGLRMMALYRSEHVFPKHMHETYSIGVNLEGAHETRHRGTRYVVSGAAIALLDPGEPHTGARHGAEPWSFFGLYPSAEFVARLCEDIGPGGVPHFPSTRVDDATLAARLARIGRMVEGGGDALAVESEVTGAMAELFLRHAEKHPRMPASGDERDGLERAREYIHARVERGVRLAEIAEVAGLSRYHFLRVFRDTYGLTPHAYLTQLRITRARRMLDRGDDISRVAYRLGFADQSHFTKRFVHWVGVTPGEYRAAPRV